MLKSIEAEHGEVFWIKVLRLGLPSKRSANPGEIRQISEGSKYQQEEVTGISRTTESGLTRILIPQETRKLRAGGGGIIVNPGGD